ncbi:hypothetical protein [Limosilactobacillus sp.]|uniref:hypothetical protein n=1 Tax=Limosilactobacillus sp. TaxID=2773925 RepID=UPI0035A0CD81
MTSLMNKGKRIGEVRLDGPTIYEIAFSFYFVIAFFQTSTYIDYFPSNFLHELSFIPLAMVLCKIFLLDRLNKRTLLFNLLVLALLGITWRTSGEYILLPMGIFILGARNVDFRRIIYLYLVLGTILLSFIFFTSLVGLTKDLIFHRGNGLIRRSFGIIYPTDFAAHVLYLVIAYCYLYFKRIGWQSYVVFIMIAYALSKFCNARLSSYSLILLIPVMIIGQYAQKKNNLCRKLASFYWMVPSVLAYVILLITYLYKPGNNFLEHVNSLLSGRLYYGHTGLMQHSLTLFGQRMHENGLGYGAKFATVNDANYFYVDSSFVRTLILYGAIVLLLVVITMTVISWRSIANHDFALASVMVIVTISAVVEQRLFDFGYDPFLLAIFANCYLQRREIKLEEQH